MKLYNFIIILFAFIAILLSSCSNNSESKLRDAAEEQEKKLYEKVIKSDNLSDHYNYLNTYSTHSNEIKDDLYRKTMKLKNINDYREYLKRYKDEKMQTIYYERLRFIQDSLIEISKRNCALYLMILHTKFSKYPDTLLVSIKINKYYSNIKADTAIYTQELNKLGDSFFNYLTEVFKEYNIILTNLPNTSYSCGLYPSDSSKIPIVYKKKCSDNDYYIELNMDICSGSRYLQTPSNYSFMSIRIQNLLIRSYCIKNNLRINEPLLQTWGVNIDPPYNIRYEGYKYPEEALIDALKIKVGENMDYLFNLNIDRED